MVINLRLFLTLGLTLLAILLLWFTYSKGFDSGVAITTIKYDLAEDEAVIEYQSILKKRTDEYNRKLDEINSQYQNELIAQTTDSELLHEELLLSAEKTIVIKEKVKYVESDCTNVGNDAFLLYQQTRRIVSDPRSTRITTSF